MIRVCHFSSIVAISSMFFINVLSDIVVKTCTSINIVVDRSETKISKISSMSHIRNVYCR